MKQLYSHYFPTPTYLAMNSCGFDISDQSIKYGELHASQGGLRLGRYGQVKIPQGVITQGVIADESKLVAILKDLAVREHLHFVRVSLPEEQMYLFTIALPQMDHKNIRDTLMLQLEEHIPLQAVNTVFDFTIIASDAQTIYLEVVAIATTIIESYVSVFERAGLVPLSFELEAQAIARVVVPYQDTHAVMIVDFGETRTGVSITQGGHVFFTTTLDIGGTALTTMIAKTFNVSFEEAEKMKRQSHHDDPTHAEDIFPAILNGLSVLRDELTKHSLYWQTHDDGGVKHEPLNRIILCGGDANLAGLAEYLELGMKIPVESANSWVNISNMEVSIPDMSFQESLGYVTVLGLAFGDYIPDANSVINVLPLAEKQKLRRTYWMRFTSIIFSLVALAGVFSIALLFPSYFYSQSKQSLAESRLETFNRSNPEITTRSVDTVVMGINKKLGLFSFSVDEHPLYELLSDTLLVARPAGIRYTQIFYRERSGTNPGRILEVNGIADTRDTLQLFKKQLDANPKFKEVILPISSFLGRENLTFSITITLK